jgi:hypothetical protein
MFDALLSVGAMVTAIIHLGDWIVSPTPENLFPVLASSFFSLYAYRVYWLRRRLSRQRVGKLLEALRQGA